MHACHDDADTQASAHRCYNDDESVVGCERGIFVGKGQTGCRVLGAGAQRGTREGQRFRVLVLQDVSSFLMGAPRQRYTVPSCSWDDWLFSCDVDPTPLASVPSPTSLSPFVPRTLCISELLSRFWRCLFMFATQGERFMGLMQSIPPQQISTELATEYLFPHLSVTTDGGGNGDD